MQIQIRSAGEGLVSAHTGEVLICVMIQPRRAEYDLLREWPCSTWIAVKLTFLCSGAPNRRVPFSGRRIED